MLVRPEGDDAVLLIGQAAHAWVAGQIARAWAADLPHRPALELAAIQHDIGWIDLDLEPQPDPETGWPRSFMQTPLDVHLGLWTRAPGRVLSQSRVAALCVSLHGTKLYGRRDLTKMGEEDAAAVRAYLAGQRALQEHLMAETGVTADEAAAMQDVLFRWDWLALGLPLGWAPSTFRDDMTLHEHTVDPWPFAADEVTFVCEGRRLTERHADPAELQAAVARAEPVELRYTLTRAPSGAP